MVSKSRRRWKDGIKIYDMKETSVEVIRTATVGGSINSNRKSFEDVRLGCRLPEVSTVIVISCLSPTLRYDSASSLLCLYTVELPGLLWSDFARTLQANTA